MRLAISRKTLRWTQRALFAGAFLMLGYCGFVLTDAWAFQHRESLQLDRILADRQEANGGAAGEAAFDTSPEDPQPAAMEDGLIGRIEVARLGLSAIVMEGTDTTTLRRAVGHIEGTAMPGEQGNIGISGHRDTFFRPLRNIRENDIITVTTPAGEYRYRVLSASVVSPDDVAVLDADGNEILTLVTCYPFYFVGAAPSRFIVRAERVT